MQTDHRIPVKRLSIFNNNLDTREDLNMATKGKPKEGNLILSSRKNNSMGIFNNKLAKSHKRRLEHGYERET